MPRPFFPTQRFSSTTRGPTDVPSPTHGSNRTAPPRASTALLNAVADALQRVVEDHRPAASVTVLSDADALETRQVDPPSCSTASREATRTFRVDGPRGGTVRLRVSASPLRATERTPYAVTVGIDGGPLVRYTMRSPDSSPSDAETTAPIPTLRRKAEAFLRRELQTRLDAAATVDTLPRLTLDDEGRIQSLSPAARRALEYPPDAAPDSNFFSHVAGDNLGRVLRDLGRMVQDDCQHARWIVRLRTGTGRWRWYRAEVRNELAANDAITITVWPLGVVQAPHAEAA